MWDTIEVQKRNYILRNSPPQNFIHPILYRCNLLLHLRIQPFFGFLTLALVAYLLLCVKINKNRYTFNQLVYVGPGVFGILLLVYSLANDKSGLIRRPHPAFWRCIYSCGLLYLFGAIVLAIVPKQTGRNIVSLMLGEENVSQSSQTNLHVSENVNVVFMGTIDLSCEVSLRTLGIQLRKMWFYAHILGWFAKMCIFRDWLFCFILSVAFETVELSFQEFIPELKECWWDSLFLDIIISNTLGMVAGYILLRYFRSQRYCWFYPTSPSDLKSYQLLLKRPYENQRSNDRKFPFYSLRFLTRDPNLQWRFLRTPERFFQVLFLFVAALLSELMVFFIMYILNIPAKHIFHKIRATLLCFLALNGVAELYYSDSKANVNESNDTSKRRPLVRHNLRLFFLITSIELFVLFRYKEERFREINLKCTVIIPWIVSLLCFSSWLFSHYIIVGSERLDYSPSDWNKLLKQVKTVNRDHQITQTKCHPPLPLDVALFLKRQKLWGRSWNLAAAIVSLPPFLSFLPLIFLVQHYDYD